MTEQIIGIDLGTTNTCISYLTNENKPQVIPNHLNLNTTPSFVTYQRPNQDLNKLIKDLSLNILDKKTFAEKFTKKDQMEGTERIDDSFNLCTQRYNTINNSKGQKSNSLHVSKNSKSPFDRKNISCTKKDAIKKLKNSDTKTPNSQKSECVIDTQTHVEQAKGHTPSNSTFWKLLISPFSRIFLRKSKTENSDTKSEQVDKIQTFKPQSNPSMQSLDMFSDKNVIVGDVSKALQEYFPASTVFAFKRLIGRKSSDKGLEEYINTLSYKTQVQENGDLYVQVPLIEENSQLTENKRPYDDNRSHLPKYENDAPNKNPKELLDNNISGPNITESENGIYTSIDKPNEYLNKYSHGSDKMEFGNGNKTRIKNPKEPFDKNIRSSNITEPENEKIKPLDGFQKTHEEAVSVPDDANISHNNVGILKSKNSSLNMTPTTNDIEFTSPVSITSISNNQNSKNEIRRINDENIQSDANKITIDPSLGNSNLFDDENFSQKTVGTQNNHIQTPSDNLSINGNTEISNNESHQNTYRNLSPVQISADLLKYMKKCAENYLKTPVKKAIITVPAYFNNEQRSATKMAGKLAGLDVVRVLSEPTAAALAYGLNKKDNKTIVVYDLGGGTFDVSVLEMENGVFEVKSVNGDSHLGGEDIDIAIMNDVLGRIKSLHMAEKPFAEDVSKLNTEPAILDQTDSKSQLESKGTTLEGKKGGMVFELLSKRFFKNPGFDHIIQKLDTKTIPTTNCKIDKGFGLNIGNDMFVSDQQNEPKNFESLRNLHKDFVIHDSLSPYSDSLNQSGVQIFNVDDFTVPALKTQVEQLKIYLSTNETAFLIVHSKNLNSGKKYVLTYHKRDIENLAAPIIERTLQKCSLALKDANLSENKIDHIILVGGPTKMPFIQSCIEKYFKKRPNTNIDPDLAISLGASIQAGIIDNRIDACLLDVNSLSLGIETIGGLFSKVIERNSKIPVKKSQIYTNSEDNQEEVIIRIYQGERPLVKNNKFLGEMKLVNLEKRKKGQHRIEVVFECDVNGILKVSGKDLITNKEQQIILKQDTGLTDEEVSKLIEETKKLEKHDAILVKCAEFKLELQKLSQTQNIPPDLLSVIQKYTQLEFFDVDAARKEIYQYF